MNKLVCDVCGGNITMQSGGQVGICSCCGLNYSLDRMREIASGIKVSQTGSAEDVEQWRTLVAKYMDSCAFADAENIVKKILEAIPNDPQANEQYDELQTMKYFDIRNGMLVAYSGNAKKVVIPPSVKEIRFGVFEGNKFLEEVIYPASCVWQGGINFQSCTRLKKFKLPDNLQSIGFGAFMGCTSLTEVTFPEGLKEIGDGAFSDCTSLTEVIFPEGLQSIGDNSDTLIKTGTFRGCTSLTEIKLPEGLQSIGEDAFRGCTSLTEVAFPEGLKKIDKYAFKDCTSLTEVAFPEGLQSIGSWAFKDCTSLTGVTFPEGLKEIVYDTFRGCTSLTKVTFPKGLEKIGEDAFRGCTSLTEVAFPEGLKKIDEDAFKDCTSLANVVLPEGVILAYAVFQNTKYEKQQYEKQQHEKQQRSIANGICPSCGGKLSVFGKRCKTCGRTW